MFDLTISETLHLAGCQTVALVFLLAGLMKALDAAQTVDAVGAYELLPSQMVGPVARVLPWIELILGLALFIGLAVSLATVGALSLLAIFTFAQTITLAKGRQEVPCGCFGSASARAVSWSKVISNSVLMLGEQLSNLDAAAKSPQRGLARS